MGFGARGFSPQEAECMTASGEIDRKKPARLRHSSGQNHISKAAFRSMG